MLFLHQIKNTLNPSIQQNYQLGIPPEYRTPRPRVAVYSSALFWVSVLKMLLKPSYPPFWRYITVEPTIFFFFLTCQVMDFLNRNMYLQKTCRNNTQIEPNISTPCDDEKRGLDFLMSTYSNYYLATHAVTIILTVFATTYSDLAGKKRKIFIVMPIVAALLQTVSACLQALFWAWPPLLGVILDALLPNLGGGSMCTITFSKVYLCDVTEIENRHCRITLLMVVGLLCLLIGKGAAGYLLYSLGFVYSYLVCVLFMTFALVSAIWLIEDKSQKVQEKINLSEILSLKQIWVSFKIVLFSKNSSRHRKAIFISFVIGILAYFSISGEMNVYYYYFRYRFSWDERKYSAYSAYKLALGIIGSLLCSLIMSKLLKIHDSMIGAFAAFWNVLACIGYFFAVDEWQIYAVPLLEMFQGVSLATCFSFVSKFFKAEEYGRLLSVHMMFGLLVVSGIPVYNAIFQNTIDVMPHAFFLLSTTLNFLMFILYCITYFLSKEIR